MTIYFYSCGKHTALTAYVIFGVCSRMYCCVSFRHGEYPGWDANRHFGCKWLHPISI
jgi:hypothetical protein